MKSNTHNKIDQAVRVLADGGIIAYPTEGVFGFGCDPFNETAILRLLKIKQRSVDKGLILIAASWDQVKNLIKMAVSTNNIIKQNSRQPITWVLPATKKVPRLISGKFNSVAIRVTLHPIANKICQKFGGPIISTSANVDGKKPATKPDQVLEQFADVIDYVVVEPVGALNKPTEIRDVKTNKLIRR